MLLELRNACSATETALLKKTSKTIARRAFVQRTFAKGIRRRHLGPFPAIRSKLCEHKGFPLLSGVLYSAERINPERISPFGIHPRSGPVPSGFIHEVELLFLLRNWNYVVNLSSKTFATALLSSKGHSPSAFAAM